MKYKSNIQRLNESRKAYQDILSERITDGQEDLERMMGDMDLSDLEGINKPRPEKPVKPETPPKSNPSTYNEITLEPCPNNTSVGGFTSYTSPSMTIGGNTPTVGMVANLDTNPLSTLTGNWEVTAVNQTSQTCNHSSNVGGICNFDVGSCEGSTPCDFPTISAGCASTADLTNQFANNNPSQFLSNMASWYANPPGPNGGCNFLEVVRQKHLGHLATGIVINSNNPNGAQMGPAWIAQKTAKVSYLDCVLADLNAQGCCAGGGNMPENTGISTPIPYSPSTIEPEDLVTVSPTVVVPQSNPHVGFNALEESRVIKLKESDLTKMVKRIILGIK